MTCIDIHSQAECDAHKGDKDACLHIVEGHVVAWGSSHVEARGSSHVEARGSSHVVAWDSSHVEARDSSHVVAWDSSHVEARDSSHVVAWDSSHVVAWGSSHVEARGSSHVEARGSSHVEARGSSHVVARPYVAIHQQPGHTGTISGGVTIKVPSTDTCSPAEWADFYGIDGADDGSVIVFKAVDGDLRSGKGMAYPIGETVTAPDWKNERSCGNGLHFGPTPRHAATYLDAEVKRYLACRVVLADVVPLGNKVKAPSCVVLHEVDADGREIAAVAEAGAS